MGRNLEEGYRQLLRSGEVRYPWVAYQFVYELIRRLAWEGAPHVSSGERRANPAPERIVETFVREVQANFGVFAHSVLNHWRLKASRDLGDLVLQLAQVECLTLAEGESLERFAAASWVPETNS